MANWITIDSVINDYITESEKSIHSYFKLWQLAFRGLDDLGIDFFYEIRTVKVALNANGTANLPPNINWTKVGVFDFDGGFYPLTYNQNLTTYAAFSPDRLSKNNTNGGVINDLNNFYSLGTPCFYNYCGSYLSGWGWNGLWCGGSYNVDEKNGIILFDNWTSIRDVAVEIMVAPTEGEEYTIPSVFREALVEWLGWRDNKNVPIKTHAQNNSVEARKRDYYNARRLAMSRYKPFDIQQAAMS